MSKRQRKTMVILRGLPGSGKTHWVKAQKFPEDTAFCSADDFFMIDGEYCYVKSRQGEAHAHCMGLTLDAINHMAPHIVVDNTSSRRWEYNNYLKLAQMHGYEVKVVEITCQHLTMAKVFARRNNHNVPEDVIVGMFDRWERDAEAKMVYPGFTGEEEAKVKLWMANLEELNNRAEMIARAFNSIRSHETLYPHRWKFAKASYTDKFAVVTFLDNDLTPYSDHTVQFPVEYLWMSGSAWEKDARNQSQEG